MKINQFACKKTDLKTMIHELEMIQFLDTKAPKEADKLWFYFLKKTFVLEKDTSSIDQKLGNLLATADLDLFSYQSLKKTVTKEVFYTVALQLLGFQPELDFTLANQAVFIAETNIPIVEGDYRQAGTILQSWYLLLNTHGKNGLTLIDHLANQGYYANKTVPKPLFFNGKAQAVFDVNRLIKEVVYVEAPLDTDEDGQRDLLKLEVTRPVETNEGLLVPVLYTASPYYQGINPEDADALTYNVDIPLQRKTPNQLTYEDIRFKGKTFDLPPERDPKGHATDAVQTAIGEVTVSLNDYFLSRGFGVVYGSGIGTRDSDGIQTCGSVEQTISTVAYIEWLTGKRRAFTNKTDNIEIKAWWCNGKIAMTGKSYLGTLATAAATTGVEGLETIISEAAISNWYQYYRDNGLVIAPDACQGEDADVLAALTFSRKHDAGDYLKIKEFFDQKLKRMAVEQDRKLGDYTTFWDERNYLPKVQNTKADIVMVHGLNDWNVKPRHVYQLWHELIKVPGVHKMILHQGEHIYINNQPSIDFQDQMNLWLSYKLYGVENNAAEQLPTVLYQDNRQPETWRTLSDWDSENWCTLYFGKGKLVSEPVSGTYTFQDRLSEELFESYKKDVAQWEEDLKTAKSPMENHRYLAVSEPEDDLFLKGTPKVKLLVSSSQNIGMLSVQLVDFGEAKRLKKTPDIIETNGLQLGYHGEKINLMEFKEAASTPFKMITKGHINLQNRHNSWKTDDLRAEEFVEVEVELQPTLYHLPKGHQIGLIVYSTDFGMTIRGNQNISYTLALNSCSLQLPRG